jgi:3-deoxy-D-manno-octulosonate 8-phosphate phosphatase (KDO 8-P phosphatase)
MEKARKVRFLLLDVDGVMTDGTIFLDDAGREWKGFHIHDGYGLHRLQESGVHVGIVTARRSNVVDLRARELGITEVYQNAFDKEKVYDGLLKKYALTDSQMAYVGDDVIDLPILDRVGLAVAVGNAVREVRAHADWITVKPGGYGAVREVTDLLMDAKRAR